MSILRFDGAGAGLGKRQGGDANDPCSYTLVCRCGADQGPLARFLPSKPGPDEVRCCRCLLCDTVSIIVGTRIARVDDGKVIDAEIARSIQRYRDHLRECRLTDCADCLTSRRALDSIDRQKRAEGREIALVTPST